MSTLCEEFKATPRQIRKEDARELLNILELRAYAAAKRAIDNAKEDSQIEGVSEHMKELVFEIQYELYQERVERRKKAAEHDDGS